MECHWDDQTSNLPYEDKVCLVDASICSCARFNSQFTQLSNICNKNENKFSNILKIETIYIGINRTKYLLNSAKSKENSFLLDLQMNTLLEHLLQFKVFVKIQVNELIMNGRMQFRTETELKVILSR